MSCIKFINFISDQKLFILLKKISRDDAVMVIDVVKPLKVQNVQVGKADGPSSFFDLLDHMQETRKLNPIIFFKPGSCKFFLLSFACMCVCSEFIKSPDASITRVSIKHCIDCVVAMATDTGLVSLFQLPSTMQIGQQQVVYTQSTILYVFARLCQR